MSRFTHKHFNFKANNLFKKKLYFADTAVPLKVHVQTKKKNRKD
jgi:hypothetical protein